MGSNSKGCHMLEENTCVGVLPPLRGTIMVEGVLAAKDGSMARCDALPCREKRLKLKASLRIWIAELAVLAGGCHAKGCFPLKWLGWECFVRRPMMSYCPAAARLSVSASAAVAGT